MLYIINNNNNWSKFNLLIKKINKSQTYLKSEREALWTNLVFWGNILTIWDFLYLLLKDSSRDSIVNLGPWRPY